MPKCKKVLVTGATGFLGSAIVAALGAIAEYEVYGSVRRKQPALSKNLIFYERKLSVDTEWLPILTDKDIIVHTAALAHNTALRNSAEYIEALKKVNIDATLHLARQAADAGVKRFIFISSIGVNGNSTEIPFTAHDEPSPREDYAVTKLKAEQGLQNICYQSGMELVIIRPPLIYGKNAPGNFKRLVELVRTGLPLPLAAIQNRRSFVGVDNLVDLVVRCLTHLKASGQVFLVSDGEDISTPDLFTELAQLLGRSPRLFAVSPGTLAFCAGLLGKKELVHKLTADLQVDMEHTKTTLDWSPPLTLREGLRLCFDDE